MFRLPFILPLGSGVGLSGLCSFIDFAGRNLGRRLAFRAVLVAFRQ